MIAIGFVGEEQDYRLALVLDFALAAGVVVGGGSVGVGSEAGGSLAGGSGSAEGTSDALQVPGMRATGKIQVAVRMTPKPSS